MGVEPPGRRIGRFDRADASLREARGALAKLSDLRDLHGHPFRLYERVGFEVSGVVPDADGFGKPDLLKAKRVAR